jgi:hypothetical protein
MNFTDWMSEFRAALQRDLEGLMYWERASTCARCSASDLDDVCAEIGTVDVGDVTVDYWVAQRG